MISAGIPCTVSYFHDGKLVGYRSEIRDVLSSPVPLLFIAYPKTIGEMHMRKHVRIPSNEPILLMQADQGHLSESTHPTDDHFGGLLKDLSERGCSVALVQRPAWLCPGSTVRLELELPGLGHIANLTGIVKDSDVHHDSNLVGIEFRFNELEYIEYRGWGGSVRNAIEQCVVQKVGASFLAP